MANPREFGLDHDDWRTHQEETVDWSLGQSAVKILEAPTGSGKTAIARAVSSQRRVVSLVRTKVLQEENYDKGYQFDTLYGRSNYDCVYEKARRGATADHCAFAEEGMNKCPQINYCPYVQARDTAKASERASLNYAYWLHTHYKWPEFDMLVCDEAHELSKITLEWAGITVNNEERVEFELPPFPILRSGGATSIINKQSSVEERAFSWLQLCIDRLAEQYKHVEYKAKSDENARKRARKLELMGKKFAATASALKTSQNDWYIRSGPGVVDKAWGFVARPLTAKHHFKTYFTRAWDLMLMSATIGNPQTFAAELGLGEYDFRAVPSVWPASTRPVHALDVPRLGYKSSHADWECQADQIAKAIRDCPADWYGIIHVTSIAEASRLAERLARRGLQDRVYVSPRASTEKIVEAWRQRMAQKPGSLLVSWALWEGYNGLDEKICIAAKVPYPFLGDQYEIERRNYDGKFFLQRAAWQIEQGLGRTRRGRLEDYDTDGVQRSYVAIADGGWKWLRNYFSPAFRESLVT